MPSQQTAKVAQREKRGTQNPKPKTMALPPVQNMPQLHAQMKALDELMSRRDALLNELQQQIALLEAASAAQVQALTSKLLAGAAAIFPFAQENRSALTPGEKKSVALAEGILRWYAAGRTVSIEKGQEEEVLALLKRLNLDKYIRFKEAVNIAKMKEDLDEVEKLALKGVTISEAGEYFAIAPVSSESFVRRHTAKGMRWSIQTPEKTKEKIPD